MKVAIIPARMAASRFPGKPMAKVLGIPMVGHVYYRTMMSRNLDAVYVATCDAEIYDYVHSIGGKAVMTKDTHERCTDRTAEAMLKIEDEIGKKIGVVVMVQGDEPMLMPQMLEQSLACLSSAADVQAACLMGRIETTEEFEDPNCVKVVTDLAGYALYFSREPIPSVKKCKTTFPKYKQVPIISFRRDYLLRFNDLTPTPLEQTESVDMMRILEHGDRLKMAVTEFSTRAIDTPQDLQLVEKLMQTDRLLPMYKK